MCIRDSDYKDVPTLPTGYGGCFAIAFFPPAWFKMMDGRVMDWAEGDISKVNLDPKKKDKLYKNGARLRLLSQRKSFNG